MAAGTHLCDRAGCCRLSGGVLRVHVGVDDWRRPRAFADAPSALTAGCANRHYNLRSRRRPPLIVRRVRRASRRPVLPTRPRRRTHTSQSARVPEVRSNQLNRLTHPTGRAFGMPPGCRLIMISARSADREKSGNYDTESPSQQASDCGSLLCLMQVTASDFAALEKVRAFSYGRRHMSRVFLPKLTCRFRWYDHLRQFPSSCGRGVC